MLAIVTNINYISSPSIVIVSSLAHENGKMNWDDINWENSYDEWKAYSQSKLANVLHGVELAKKLENTGISVYTLHPGMYVCNSSSLVTFRHLSLS